MSSDKDAAQIDNDLSEMAKNWYGYGRWEAPFWFLGPEPGMVDDGTNDLEARCEAWIALGRGELVGCREHHLGFGFKNWHSPEPPIQRTWGKLIRLVFAFKGVDATTNQIREYQRDLWGAINGETCAIELSSMAAHDSGDERNRQEFESPRIATLRQRVLEYRPSFVVMFGKTNQPEWGRIANAHFAEAPDLCRLEQTTVLYTQHPRWWSNDDAWCYGKLLWKTITSSEG